MAAAVAKRDVLTVNPSVSYTELARRVGVSVAYISLIMAGKRSPSLPVADKLAGALGCSIDALNKHLKSAQAA